ncbi:MAG: protein kinase domain-containing protein [Isosphaeraceae bacterium]
MTTDGKGEIDRIDTGRNLLFGLLALQNSFIDRDALLAAFNAWLADKSRPLGAILCARGALDGPRHALLEALVGEHLRLHGGDPDRSLAALELGGSTRETLRSVGDPDLDASLAHAGSFSTNVDATDIFAGRSTSSGGRFRVLRPHARGGLGQIYVARDEELGRQVALKEILADKADNPRLRSRFLLEAEISGNLEHPGIVPVYSLGTYDDGRPYYAMRFIEGDSLKEAIEAYHAAAAAPDPNASNLRLRQLLGRFVDVCDAIAYAHSRGVLHRDLKPGNVMLGSYGETLIIDWGLAKAVGHRDPASADIATTLVPPSSDSHEPTVAGHLLGSPPYMSPEQALGLLEDLGPATDVYGLGATLYAILTGKAPVDGATVEEVLTKVRKGSIVPPRQLNARVPRALEAVCLKALALQPSDRYSSARALAGDIEHWLADEPVTALAEPLRDRVGRWARRHRTLVTTAAAVLLLGLIGLAAFAAVVGDKNRKLVAANRATSQAESLADARLDRAMTSIEDYFTGFSADALKGGQLPPALRDRLLAKPRQYYEQLAAELAAKTNPSEREQALLARGHYNLGRILRILGKNKEARTEGEAAVAGFEALVARHPEVAGYQAGLAMSHVSLALVLADAGGPDLAAAAYKKAIAIYEGLAARHPDVAEHQHGLAYSHNNLGITFANSGRSEEAAAEYKRAIAIHQALVARHPDVAEYQNGLAANHNNAATIFAAMGRHDQAADELKAAVTIFEVLAARYPDVADYQNGLARSHNNLGFVLAANGRSEEAAGAYKKAIAIDEALVARHRNVPDYQNWLAGSQRNFGALLKAQGNFALALTEFHRAEKFAPPRSAVAASLPGLIRETENAIALANRLPAVLKGEDKPRDPAEGLAFAQLCYDQSHYAAAARLWDEALATDPRLAADRQTRQRYNAACSAALAAAGKGKDEPPLHDDAKAKLRVLACGWLKAELAAWTKVLETGAENAKAAVVSTLRHWQMDPDLAGIRDPEALEKLPEAEQKGWRDLWAAVGALTGNAPGRR